MNKVLTEDIIPSLKDKIPYLYTGYGINTDGAVTQNFINTVLNSTYVKIGSGAFVSGTNSIAIGNTAQVINANNGIAIGNGATVSLNHTGSIALGSGSITGGPGQVAIGNRKITYVSAGTGNSDAVNLKQMNDAITAAVGDINTILEQYDTGAGV